MKKISILCLLLLSALMLLVGCKADPEAINNTPEVFADEASDVLRTSAVLTGRIMAPAKASIKEYGFLVSSSSDFTSSDTQTIQCDENLKEFSAQITDLEIGGTYFYAAYATGGLDRMTSTVRAFTTPTRSGVLLSELRMVDEKTATFSARVADTGGGEINAVGLCWATDNTPTTYDETVITTLNSDNTFTASLTGLEAGKTYYVRAFADSDILGDGTTQTISYSRDVVEIHLEEDPEPTVSLKKVAATTASLTFSITSTDAEEVRWMILPESSLDIYDEITAEIVLGSENEAEPNKTVEITAEELEPETTYTIYAAAENKGVKVLSQKLEMTTDAVPIDPESCKIYYTSTGGNIVEPHDTTVFGANIVSNTYENGQGVILFDGPVMEIGREAFWQCTGLTSVTIPDSVTSIGEYTFYECSGLTSVTIPDSVTTIGDDAFRNCTSLTSVTIPDSLTEIGNGVFWGTSLTSITIPDSVTTIGDDAFGECTGLTSITIPDSVTSIGAYAFYGCTGLTSVTIPDSVTSIGEVAFCGCIGLTAFYGKYATEDNLCLIVNSVLNAFAIGSGATEYAIPDSVTSIGWEAFHNCESLTSVTIPDSVTSIGVSVFANCSGLTSVYCKPTIPPIGASYMFYGNAFGRKIYVPAKSVDAYKAAAYWSDYAYAIYPMEEESPVAKIPYGYRAGSEEVVWSKALSELSLTAANANHIAATGKYLIVAAAGEAPVVLDALTGEYVQTLDLGEMAGANAAITADSEGNIVVSSFAEATGFRIGRMKDINDTLEVFITHELHEYGKDLSVVGDVYGDARLTLMYSPWSSGTTGHLLFTVSGGVADDGYWSKIFAGEITDKIDNNNGDVIYRDMGEGAPYFMTGYSSNGFVWAEDRTAQAFQKTCDNNLGAICLDVVEFNGAKYLMTACDTYFTWSLAYAGIYMADVTTIENFKAGVVYFSTGALEWNAASMGGGTDCALSVSEDGVYMYAYVLHPGGKVGCIRVDCLDK